LKISVIPSDFDEQSVAIDDPPVYARILAEGKAEAVARQHPDDWVIGADTVVVIGDRVLGKPRSPEAARKMLATLSGRTHQVYTGYCVARRTGGHHFADTVKTDVIFKRLTPTEIEWYIRTGEPFDKAGAYAIQGIGTFLVRAISGSYTNVVGLPVCEIVEHLLEHGIIGFDMGAAVDN